MDRPVVDQFIPNNGADDIEFDDAELVWIAAWCSPERKANDRLERSRGVFCFPCNFNDDCMHIARMLEGEIKKSLPPEIGRPPTQSQSVVCPFLSPQMSFAV